jgi:hypothetical protein
MQSLCTLRDHCRQGSRNTRYQAGATPYLGRTSTGWIAPACLAHSLDHLVSERDQVRRQFDAGCSGGLQIDDKGITLLERQVGDAFEGFFDVGLVGPRLLKSIFETILFESGYYTI